MRRLSRMISKLLDKIAIKRRDSRTVITFKLVALVPLCLTLGLLCCLFEGLKEYWDDIKVIPGDIREMYRRRS